MEIAKTVPGFRTIIRRCSVPDLDRMPELMNWCRRFQQSGLTPVYELGTLGNLSFRVKPWSEHHFVITGTKLGAKDRLTNDSFAEVVSCDEYNHIVYAHGTREPSSEVFLHYSIYQNRPDVCAIFHGHCDLILNAAQVLGIPQTAKEEPFGTLALARAVRYILGRENFVIMKNHGFISMGHDMDEAGRIAMDILGWAASLDRQE
ncbi:MAG: class II aldolase/adducin family protein [Candidatus Margulisiibacteriota bacterium]